METQGCNVQVISSFTLMARLRNQDKQRGTGRKGRKGYNEAKEAMNINNMEFKVETL